MKRKFLLLVCAVLMGSVEMMGYTGSEPTVGRTYFLYNIGANAYFVGTSGSYGKNSNIANATPVTVESGSSGKFKLAFVDGGTTYRIYHNDGSANPGNTSGVEFTKVADGTGYKLQSKNKEGLGSGSNRDMHADGYFPKTSDGSSNVTWQFISCDEVAETHYVTSAKGWEKVTSVAELKTSPEDYFFAIFSANAPGLMVDASSSNAESTRPYYKTATNPLSSAQYLFEIENYDSDGFALKSCDLNKYFGNNSDSWNFQNLTNIEANCKLTITLNDGAYQLQSANADWEGRRYWGLYDYTGYTNGQKFAGNKSDAEKGSFLIYRIAKENLNMTSRIVNPKAATDTNGWTGFDGNVTKRNTGSGFDGEVGFFELCDWGATWDLTVSQSVNNQPNGYYMVQVAGQLSDRETTMTLTVNGESRNFEAHGTLSGNILADGTQTFAGGGVAGWRYNSVVAQVTDRTLTITVHGVATAINRWANFDNVTLTYIGSSLPESLTSVSGKMNADVATAQTNAVNTYESSKTAANLNSALRAIAAAEVSKAAYANAAVYLSNVEALLATTNFYTPDAYNYNSVYGTYKTAYDAGTLDDATAAGLTYKVAGSGGTDRYTNNTANDLLIPGWTIGGNDATTTDSGFYINTWSTEDNSNGFANPFYEYWVGSGSLSETALVGTVSGLTPNATYAVTSNVRVQGSDKVANSVRMQVGSGTPVDVTQGNQIGSTSRYVKSYTAVGSTDGSGNLTLKFIVDANSNISWLSFRDINYELRASDEQKTALANAITNAEGKPLGFEDGEYAPYDNISVLEALAAAKALDANSATAKEVVAATNSIVDSEWTAHDGDVECVYNGDFAIGQGSPAANIQEYGWTRTNGWGEFHSDSDKSSTSNGTSYYNQPGSLQYGNAGYYTMPLKANTIYQLTFKYASWQENSNNWVKASVLKSGEGMAAVTYEKNATIHSSEGAFVEKTILFVTTTAGDYVLTLNNDGNTVITDVSIRKASQTLTLPSATQYAAGTYPSVTLDRTFASMSNWYTLCAPFDFPKSAFAEVKVLDKVTDTAGDVNMTFTDASETIAAGTPCLVKPASADATLSVEDVAIDPATLAGRTEKSSGTTTVAYVGKFENTVINGSTDTNAWVVSNNALYHVAEGHNATVGAYRAYFTVSASEGVKALSYDFGGADAIDDVRSKIEDGRNEIYNLAGQKMSKLQRGVNIVNGKKVLVK